MDWFDDVKGGDLLVAAIPAVTSLVGGLFAGRQQDKQLKDAADARRDERLLALDLEELKYKYGLGGGGGGGASAAQKAQVYQNAAAIEGDARQRQIAALSKLGDAIAAAYLGGKR